MRKQSSAAGGKTTPSRSRSFGLVVRLVPTLLLACMTTLSHSVPCNAQATENEVKAADNSEISKEEFQVPANEKLAAEINELLLKLNAPDYTERQTATDRLRKIGPPAFPKLRDTYLATDELEVRLRIEQILHSAYMDHHVYSGHPYMGIQLEPVDGRETKVPIPPGTPAVKIRTIFPDTPAQQAGLREGDVLTAQDGAPLRGTGQEVLRSFTAGIATRKPYTRLNVTVVREDGTHEVEVLLGRLPSDTVQPTRFTGLVEKLERAKEQFHPWWDFHFHKPAEKTPSAPASER